MADSDVIVRRFVDDTELALAKRSLKAVTKEAYLRRLRHFAGWCQESEVDPYLAGPEVILRYRSSLDTRLSPVTADHAMSILHQLYLRLVEDGKLERSPAEGMRHNAVRVPKLRSFTLGQLRSLYAAASLPWQRAAILLLAANGLGIDEMIGTRVEHLGVRDGLPILNLPARKGKNEFAFTVLAPFTLRAVEECVGKRSRGPILLSQANRRLSRRNLADTLERLSRRAGIEPFVTPRELKDSLRFLAVQRGFSVVSVVRAVGETDTRRLMRWVMNADAPLRQHASWRIGRLMEHDELSPEALLDQAEALLYETDAPPATALGLAAGAYERHLREWCLSKDFPDNKRTIGAYTSFLVKRRLIPNGYGQVGARIAELRDLAAHGWFDVVTKEEAVWVIDQCRDFVDRFRNDL